MLLLRRLLAHHRSALCPLLRGAVSLPHVCSPHNPHAAPWPPSAHSFPSSDFIKDSRRSFAKGRKSRDDDDASTARVEDIGPVVKSTAVSQMEAAIDALSRELVKLRTGRASPDPQRAGESHCFISLRLKSEIRWSATHSCHSSINQRAHTGYVQGCGQVK
uniref:Uncharacterized protein n=1 Tax=Opuntia streptacantha TaxID=393608 RepID=A0A7C8ZTI1_OPUST